MEGYLRDKFCQHQAINSMFTHFLTHHMADQMSVGLKGTVDGLKSSMTELSRKVKSIKSDSSKKVTQEISTSSRARRRM